MSIDLLRSFGSSSAPSASAPRVAVIGAGASGLNTALHLAAAGVHDIVIIEAEHPAAGTSALSIGMIETQLIEEVDIAPRVYGRRVVEWLHREHGLTWTPCGYLRLGRDTSDAQDFYGSVAIQRRWGIDDAEVLTPRQIERRWPCLVVGDRTAGLYGAGDGYIDGHEFCALLVRLVKAAGGALKSRARLLGASRHSLGWTLDTTGGAVTADYVVNAAGPWAQQVGQILGAPVTIDAQTHGAAVVDVSRCDLGVVPFVMDLSIRNPIEGLYFRLEGKGQMFAGLHVEESGNGVLPSAELGRLSDAELERVAEELQRRVIGLDEAAIISSWTGLYPVTRDLHPVAGRHPLDDTVICAVGPGGSGIQLGPAIGAVAAAAITDATVDIGGAELLWDPARDAARS